MSLINKILINGLLIIISIFFFFLVLEMYLRIIGYSGRIHKIDYNTGLLILKPNNTFIHKPKDCIANRVKTNSLGFHAWEEYSLNKTNGNEIRILVVGDSFVECLQVPYNRCFHKVLEEKINNWLKTFTDKRVTVYPLGISSNGRLANLLYFEKYGKSLKPDLVIDLFISNDVCDDMHELRALEDAYSYRYKPYVKIKENQLLDWEFIEAWLDQNKKSSQSGLKNILHHSKALHFIYHKFKEARQNIQLARIEKAKEISISLIPVSYQIFLQDYPDLWVKAWKEEEVVIRTFNKSVKEIGANYLLVSGTDGFCVHQDLKEKSILRDEKRFDCFKIEKMLSEITKKENIPYLGLLSPFIEWAKKNPDKKTVFDCDGHWNEIGHQLAGELIANYLMANLTLLKIK